MTDAGSTRFTVDVLNVSHERLDGEVIAVHLGTGRYYSMSGAAADAWTLLAAGACVDEAVRELSSAFGGADIPDADVTSFLEDCVDAHLLLPAGDDAAAGGGVLPDDYRRDQWRAPVLEAFDDLEDLILVDPVHDTTALGWPHVESPGD